MLVLTVASRWITGSYLKADYIYRLYRLYRIYMEPLGVDARRIDQMIPQHVHTVWDALLSNDYSAKLLHTYIKSM